MHSRLLPALAVLALALPAAAQQLPGGPTPGAAAKDPRLQEYECKVDPANPCRGKVDFERGRLYTFRIAGPGSASFANEGNRRCVLEYSASETGVASSGRTLDVGPGQALTLPVRDANGLVVSFFNRGTGSVKCDLNVTVGRS
jgi:curli biogenesis system outer membrane secretion channel CsgG